MRWLWLAALLPLWACGDAFSSSGELGDESSAVTSGSAGGPTTSVGGAGGSGGTGGSGAGSGGGDCSGSEMKCGDLCVDVTSDPLHCGACGNDCLGGSCSAGVCESVVMATAPAELDALDSMAVDDSHVFVLGDCIGKVPTAGGDLELLWCDPVSSSRLSEFGENLYLRSSEGQGGIHRFSKNPASGAEPECIAWVGGATHGYVAISAGIIYERTNPETAIWKASLNSNACVVGAELPGIPRVRELVAGANHIFGLDVVNSSIVRFNAAGAHDVWVDQSQGLTNFATLLAVDAQNLYWSHSGRVLSKELLNGDVAEVLPTLPDTIVALKVDVGGGDYVYLVTNDGASPGGKLSRVPTTGGSLTELVTQLTGPWVVRDNVLYYWVDDDLHRQVLPP